MRVFSTLSVSQSYVNGIDIDATGSAVYFASYYNDKILVINVTVPSNLAISRTLSGSQASDRVWGPMGLKVSGDRLFAALQKDHKLMAFDVSSPLAPSLVTTITLSSKVRASLIPLALRPSPLAASPLPRRPLSRAAPLSWQMWL